MLISNGGTVIRLPVEEIKRLGRSTQGVIVMRLRGGERVSSIALVAESEEPDPGEDVEEPAPEGVENPAPADTGKND
jgi:DNA gyrase subunit A